MSFVDSKFVFMDEAGRKDSDRFFVCGFLEITDNLSFCSSLLRVSDQIRNLSIRNRLARVEKLKEEKDIDQLYNLAKSYNEFELKYYHITSENLDFYSDLIKVLFRKTNFRYTAIVADRHDLNFKKDPEGQFPLYLKAFKLYCSFCAKTSDYIFIPDNFDLNFRWNVKTGKLPKAILPLDSKSCLQLQVCDILSGVIAQSLKTARGEILNNKDRLRRPVINTLEGEIGKKIDGNLTVEEPDFYFSVWVIDWSRAKKSGHGQETQPRF
jgi:hypothetical protein